MKRFISFTLIMVATVWALSSIPAAAADALISLRGGQVKLGGELELEFIKSQDEVGSGGNSNARFAIDKVVLTPQVAFTDTITLQADIEFGGSGGAKVDEAWLKVTGLPRDSYVKVGLEDVFYKPHRKTESYPINGHAFFQDEDLGLHGGGDYNQFYWRVSITNGRHLADRKLQEDNVYPITHDNMSNTEDNDNKEIGLGVGMKHHFKERHEIDVMPFLTFGELGATDVGYINGLPGIAGSTDDSKDRYGLNLEYLLDDFTLFFQYISATDGALDRTGWYLQPSYKVYFKDRPTFTAVEFLLRYDNYEVDLVKTGNSLTWDRDSFVLAAIADVVKNVKVKAEYAFHGEETGGAEVDNNELIVQLEAKF
jgi:hypothetical protein